MSPKIIHQKNQGNFERIEGGRSHQHDRCPRARGNVKVRDFQASNGCFISPMMLQLCFLAGVSYHGMKQTGYGRYGYHGIVA